MQLQRAGVPLGPELLFQPGIALAVVLRFAGAVAPLPGSVSVLRLAFVALRLVVLRSVGARILSAVGDPVVDRKQVVTGLPRRDFGTLRRNVLCSQGQASRHRQERKKDLLSRIAPLVLVPLHIPRHKRALMHRAARALVEMAGLNSPPKAERSLLKAPLLGSCLSPRKALKVLKELRVWRRMLFEMS